MIKNKITAILVDDEGNALDVLAMLLVRNCPEVDIIDTCGNVLEAVESIKKNKPELVFLDIQMPEYAGFEIVNFLDPIDFEIIFVTAFNEFAIKAFDLSAIDYLMKPVKRERLKKAVARAVLKKNQEKNVLAYKALVNNLNQDKDPQIVIGESAGKRIIKLNEIASIEGKGAYSEINLDNDKRILVSKNLKKMGELTFGFKELFRCHKSWIVNTKKITKIKTGKREIYLKNGQIVKLSPNRVADLQLILKGS